MKIRRPYKACRFDSGSRHQELIQSGPKKAGRPRLNKPRRSGVWVSSLEEVIRVINHLSVGVGDRYTKRLECTLPQQKQRECDEQHENDEGLVMLTPEQRAWAEGHKAGQLRMPMENPYAPDSDNGKAWLMGYGEGQQLPALKVPSKPKD